MQPLETLMEIAGFFAAFIIGITLGLIGGGGSILTIPVLVYLFHIPPTIATGYSLFIVGISSLAGSYNSFRKGNIDMKAVLYFGITSIITVVLIRRLLIPIIPEHLFNLGSFAVSRSFLTMILLAVVMILASFNMIYKPTPKRSHHAPDMHYGKALIRGVEIGILTGLLGAGGGFLIIPALVMFSKLPMKKAIGTTLLIIAANSLIGFIGDTLHIHSIINWKLLLTITALAIMGIFVGNLLGLKIPGEKLKKGFGIFVLLAGCYIFLHELFIK